MQLYFFCLKVTCLIKDVFFCLSVLLMHDTPQMRKIKKEIILRTEEKLGTKCVRKMDVSEGAVWRLVQSVGKKTSQALTEGRSLIIVTKESYKRDIDNSTKRARFRER